MKRYDYNKNFDAYVKLNKKYDAIYESEGLAKHVEKKHPESLKYVERIKEIITSPDYIGVNPNEQDSSFELIKVFDNNIQIGIKVDAKKDYLYIATLHSITSAKILKRLFNGRLKFFKRH